MKDPKKSNPGSPRLVEYQKRFMSVTAVAKLTGIDRRVIQQRLDRGMSMEEAVVPNSKRGPKKK